MNVNIADIAALAALDLRPNEAEAMQQDLAAILDYVAQLSRIATDGVEPMAHLGARLQPEEGRDPEGTLRADAARPSLPQAEALAHAPAQRGNLFEVPKIVERG